MYSKHVSCTSLREEKVLLLSSSFFIYLKKASVSADESKKLNKEAVDVKEDTNYIWWIIGGITGIIFSITVIIVFFIHKRQKEIKRKEEESKLKAKRKKRKKYL